MVVQRPNGRQHAERSNVEVGPAILCFRQSDVQWRLPVDYVERVMAQRRDRRREPSQRKDTLRPAEVRIGRSPRLRRRSIRRDDDPAFGVLRIVPGARLSCSTVIVKARPLKRCATNGECPPLCFHCPITSRPCSDRTRGSMNIANWYQTSVPAFSRMASASHNSALSSFPGW